MLSSKLNYNKYWRKQHPSIWDYDFSQDILIEINPKTNNNTTQVRAAVIEILNPISFEIICLVISVSFILGIFSGLALSHL